MSFVLLICYCHAIVDAEVRLGNLSSAYDESFLAKFFHVHIIYRSIFPWGTNWRSRWVDIGNGRIGFKGLWWDFPSCCWMHEFRMVGGVLEFFQENVDCWVLTSLYLPFHKDGGEAVPEWNVEQANVMLTMLLDKRVIV